MVMNNLPLPTDIEGQVFYRSQNRQDLARDFMNARQTQQRPNTRQPEGSNKKINNTGRQIKRFPNLRIRVPDSDSTIDNGDCTKNEFNRQVLVSRLSEMQSTNNIGRQSFHSGHHQIDHSKMGVTPSYSLYTKALQERSEHSPIRTRKSQQLHAGQLQQAQLYAQNQMESELAISKSMPRRTSNTRTASRSVFKGRERKGKTIMGIKLNYFNPESKKKFSTSKLDSMNVNHDFEVFDSLQEDTAQASFDDNACLDIDLKDKLLGHQILADFSTQIVQPESLMSSDSKLQSAIDNIKSIAQLKKGRPATRNYESNMSSKIDDQNKVRTTNIKAFKAVGLISQGEKVKNIRNQQTRNSMQYDVKTGLYTKQRDCQSFERNNSLFKSFQGSENNGFLNLVEQTKENQPDFEFNIRSIKSNNNLLRQFQSRSKDPIKKDQDKFPIDSHLRSHSNFQRRSPRNKQPFENLTKIGFFTNQEDSLAEFKDENIPISPKREFKDQQEPRTKLRHGRSHMMPIGIVQDVKKQSGFCLAQPQLTKTELEQKQEIDLAYKCPSCRNIANEVHSKNICGHYFCYMCANKTPFSVYSYCNLCSESFDQLFRPPDLGQQMIQHLGINNLERQRSELYIDEGDGYNFGSDIQINLLFGNQYEQITSPNKMNIESQLYCNRWCIFFSLNNCQETTQKYIDHVCYYFPDYYKVQKIVSTQPPYLLSRTSFGQIKIGCEIFFQKHTGLQPIYIDYQVCLQKDGKTYKRPLKSYQNVQNQVLSELEDIKQDCEQNLLQDQYSSVKMIQEAFNLSNLQRQTRFDDENLHICKLEELESVQTQLRQETTQGDQDAYLIDAKLNLQNAKNTQNSYNLTPQLKNSHENCQTEGSQRGTQLRTDFRVFYQTDEKRIQELIHFQCQIKEIIDTVIIPDKVLEGIWHFRDLLIDFQEKTTEECSPILQQADEAFEEAQRITNQFGQLEGQKVKNSNHFTLSSIFNVSKDIPKEVFGFRPSINLINTMSEQALQNEGLRQIEYANPSHRDSFIKGLTFKFGKKLAKSPPENTYKFKSKYQMTKFDLTQNNRIFEVEFTSKNIPSEQGIQLVSMILYDFQAKEIYNLHLPQSSHQRLAVNFEDSTMSRTRMNQSAFIIEVPDKKQSLRLNQREQIVSANVETFNDLTVHVSFLVYSKPQTKLQEQFEEEKSQNDRHSRVLNITEIKKEVTGVFSNDKDVLPYRVFTKEKIVREKAEKVKIIEKYCQELLQQFPLSKWTKPKKKTINLMHVIARSMLIKFEWNVEDTKNGFANCSKDQSFQLQFDLGRIEELFQFSFEQKPPFSYKKITCEKCDKQFDARKMVGFRECGHRYCSGCYKVYLKGCLNKNNVEQTSCIHKDCQLVVPQHIWKQVMNQFDFKLYKTRLIEQNKESINHLECPNLNCSALVQIKDKNMQKVDVLCPKCHITFCFKCKRQAHQPLECKELDEQENSNFIGGILQTYDQSPEETSPSLRHKQRKNLPSKANTVSKTETRECPYITCKGTNKRTTGYFQKDCEVCGRNFCFLCGVKTSDHGNSCQMTPAEVASQFSTKTEYYNFFHKRFIANQDSMQNARQKLINCAESIEEFCTTSGEKKSSVNFILHANRLVVMARSAISLCYLKRFKLEDQDKQKYFDNLLDQIEFGTEKLQQRTEKDWTRYLKTNDNGIQYIKMDNNWTEFKDGLIKGTSFLQKKFETGLASIKDGMPELISSTIEKSQSTD